MSKLILSGGHRLRGEVQVHGAKNSVLPILSATYLTQGESVLHNCPDLTDVRLACTILQKLGCTVNFTQGTIGVSTVGAGGTAIPAECMREMRSSIVFLGALLARTGRAVLCAPGGCNLGPRPIDLHLMALRRMGVQIREENEMLFCCAPKGLCGATIRFPFVSVGATENILIAACAARGRTRIYNAAQEPEVVDLAHFLQQCGARIHGIGSAELEIEGVAKLNGTEYEILPDRIETATYLIAGAVTGGDLLLKNTQAALLEPVWTRLQAAGCRIQWSGSQIRLRGPEQLRAFPTVETAPHPGFPTDAQAICMTAASVARGETCFRETIFSERFRHVPALRTMGAQITVCGETALVNGVSRLHGACVHATDLRGGAALVLAGLCADGKTEITDVRHIDRGYQQIEHVLTQLGAKIRRENPWQRQEERKKAMCPAAG